MGEIPLIDLFFSGRKRPRCCLCLQLTAMRCVFRVIIVSQTPRITIVRLRKLMRILTINDRLRLIKTPRRSRQQTAQPSWTYNGSRHVFTPAAFRAQKEGEKGGLSCSVVNSAHTHMC